MLINVYMYQHGKNIWGVSPNGNMIVSGRSCFFVFFCFILSYIFENSLSQLLLFRNQAGLTCMGICAVLETPALEEPVSSMLCCHLLKVIHKQSHICLHWALPILQLVLSYCTRPGPGMSCSVVTKAVRTGYSHSPISSPIEEALNSFLSLAGHGCLHGRSFTGQTIFLSKVQLHSLRSIYLFRLFRSGRAQQLASYLPAAGKSGFL